MNSEERRRRIVKLAKLLGRSAYDIFPPWDILPAAARDALSKSRDGDYAKISEDGRELELFTWMESHHNGDSYDDRKATVRLIGDVADHVLTELERICAKQELEKMIEEEKEKKRLDQEMRARLRMEQKLLEIEDPA